MAALSVPVHDHRAALLPTPAAPAMRALHSIRLLDQLHGRIRPLHRIHWCSTFVHFQGIRHPAEMACPASRVP